jgi:hypothetical protein
MMVVEVVHVAPDEQGPNSLPDRARDGAVRVAVMTAVGGARRIPRWRRPYQPRRYS